MPKAWDELLWKCMQAQIRLFPLPALLPDALQSCSFIKMLSRTPCSSARRAATTRCGCWRRCCWRRAPWQSCWCSATAWAPAWMCPSGTRRTTASRSSARRVRAACATASSCSLLGAGWSFAVARASRCFPGEDWQHCMSTSEACAAPCVSLATACRQNRPLPLDKLYPGPVMGFCGAGYNDLATAFMSFPDETIRRLFSLGSLTPQCAPRLCLLTASGTDAHPAHLDVFTDCCSCDSLKSGRPAPAVSAWF